MPTLAPHSLFRRFLWIPKIRRWYDKLHAPGRLLGAPPTEEKLWNHFKQQLRETPGVWLRPLTRRYRNNFWVETRTLGVRTRLQTVTPVRPTKKFVITLTELPQSVQVAERCIESAKRYGEHHGLEIMPAVDKFRAPDFLTQHGLSWHHITLSDDIPPEMGCFASHYKLWQRCVELGEPIIVLEHDAIFRSPIPPLRFKHVILLSKPAHNLGAYKLEAVRSPKPREIFYPMNMLAGAHCYAITPRGAEFLVDAARRKLITAADLFINKHHLDILYYHPYLVDFSCDFSTHVTHHPGDPTSEEVWAKYGTKPG